MDNMVMLNGIYSVKGISTPASNNDSRYLENLSEIADSADTRSQSYGKYTDQQMLEASKKLNAREYAAFGYFGNDASTAGIKRFAEAYLSYINKLSPEEQNGVRYKGTKESMTALLASANAELTTEQANLGKKSVKPTSLLTMLLDEMMKNFKNNGINARSTTNADFPTEKISISEAARKMSAET